MKFHEWLDGKSLFGELEQLSPGSIITVIGAENLNLLYMIRFGSRELIPSLEHVSVPAIATMLHKIYLDKWQRQADLFLNDFGIGVAETLTTTTTSTENNKKDVTTNGTQKVNADNEVELVETSGSLDSLTEAGERANTSTVTVEKSNLQSIEYQRALLESSHISSIICKDVACLVSLAIY